MSTRTVAIRALALAGIWLAFGACAPSEPDAAGTPEPTEAPSGYVPPAVPTAAEEAYPPGDAPDAALGETYTNPDFGYAIDLPAGWFVEGDGRTVIFSSFDMSAAPGRGGVPEDETKIDIVANQDFPPDVDARVAQIQAEAGGSDASFASEPLTLDSGEEAVYVRMSGGMAGDTAVVVTILGGRLYQLQAYGDPSPLPAIARTFRVAAGAGADAGAAPPALSNPASEHCRASGGRLAIETRPDGGEFGVCVLSGGRQCEEWALLRGDCPSDGVEVTGYVTAAGRWCAITGGQYAVTTPGDAESEQGTCRLPDGSVCDAWEHWRGTCGPGAS